MASHVSQSRSPRLKITYKALWSTFLSPPAPSLPLDPVSHHFPPHSLYLSQLCVLMGSVAPLPTIPQQGGHSLFKPLHLLFPLTETFPRGSQLNFFRSLITCYLMTTLLKTSSSPLPSCFPFLLYFRLCHLSSSNISLSLSFPPFLPPLLASLSLSLPPSLSLSLLLDLNISSLKAEIFFFFHFHWYNS